MAREINLVPDIKNDMIKALKLRNLIFFISIVVASASVGVTLVTALIMVGQQAALDGKAKSIETLSTKMNSYADLKDFLTIRDQLTDIDALSSNKKVLSRTFNILSALIPTGADTIKISELNVNLSDEVATFNFDAQANAGQEPFIDYNVLDAFKKSMKYMRYDYGKYVDNNGDDIPAYCMIETAEDGSVFNDPERGIYAYWTIDADGCAPKSTSADTETADSDDSSNSIISTTSKYSNKERESYGGQDVVRIWRTPQFKSWYSETEKPGKPYMGLDGTISGVEHFESSCITYSGELGQGDAGPKWTDSNESCLLVPEGENGIEISESSNGRGEDGELVLRFTSTITFDPAVFKFSNTHMLALAPSGRRNVTDSYVQIQAMFSERATDCAAGDTSCTDSTNSSPQENNSQSSGESDNTNNKGN